MEPVGVVSGWSQWVWLVSGGAVFIIKATKNPFAHFGQNFTQWKNLSCCISVTILHV